MKKVMKTIALALVAATVAAPVAVMAQQGEKEKTKEEKVKRNVDQIIITHKGDVKDKIVIEVDGEKVLVNGKEYKKGEDNDVTVSRHRIKDVNVFSGGRGNVYFNDGFTNQYRALGALMNDDRAMLGVTTEKTDAGVEIQDVSKESAAEKIGLKKGDIIKKVDDKKIETADDLSDLIREKKPGDKVAVTYLRDKKESKVTAELTKWKGANVFNFSPGMESFRMDLGDLNFDDLIARTQPPRTPAAPRVRGYSFNGGGWAGGGPKLGLSVQDTEDGKGVKVLEADEDGYGAKSGIKTDDVITEVDGKAVNSTDEIARIMRDNKDKNSIKFKVQRKGKSETVEVKIPKKLKTADL